MWPWKLGQGHTNSISSWSYIYTLVWYESVSLFRRNLAHKWVSCQCKCWCKRDTHRNLFIPSPPREGDKKHMPTYESRCRVYFASCTKLHMPLVWSKLPNFSSKSTDLVQHPAWINPEVTVYVMVKFKPCSYELAYVWLTSTEVSSRSIVGTKSAKLQHVHSWET